MLNCCIVGVCDCEVEGARGGRRDEKVGCGWMGGGSVVSCGDLWEVACLCVGKK